MKSWLRLLLHSSLAVGFLLSVNAQSQGTTVSIQGDDIHINGKPTYEGRTWNGNRVQGLLFNNRVVNATFSTQMSPRSPVPGSHHSARWKNCMPENVPSRLQRRISTKVRVGSAFAI